MSSGDEAVAAAAARARETAARNIPAFGDLPLPPDTANLREGADLDDALLALLPLVGVWRGEGEGRGKDGDYRFGQQIVVSHDGGDYLNWEARSWRLDEYGEYDKPDLRETGFWRFVTDPADWFPFEGEQVAIYHEFFADDYPANTIVGARFPTANVHLEIDAIAVLD